MRCNCLPKWVSYTLRTEGGRQTLYLDYGNHGAYVVEGLTADKMVLTAEPYDRNIDMDFMYTMIRQ